MQRTTSTATGMSRCPSDSDETHRMLASHAGEILAFLLRHCGDRHLAEDLAQDVLAQAIIGLTRLREPEALRGWLFRIAMNRLLDHTRRRRLPREDLPDSSALGGGKGPGPAETVLSQELDEVLRRELRRLPRRQCEVLMLHGVRGMDQKTIGRLLGISAAAVKMSLHHGRETLRRRIDQYLGRIPGRREDPS